MAELTRDYNIEYLGYGDVINAVANLAPANISLASYTELTNLVPDSLKDVSEESAKTDFINAENDKVDFSVVSKDIVKKFEFETRDLDLQNKLLAFGGTVVSGVWYAPTNTYNGAEKSLVIISRAVDGKMAMKVFPRVKMTAMPVGEYAGESTNNIKFMVTILEPRDASTDTAFANQMDYHKAVAPARADYNATSGVLSWTNVEGFNDGALYEYSIDAGVSWTTLATNPQTLAIGIAAILVRVKAYNSSDMSEAQWTASDSTSALVV